VVIVVVIAKAAAGRLGIVAKEALAEGATPLIPSKVCVTILLSA
jgi:hypothetical protein